MKDETGPEFRKLKARYEAILAAGGDMHFTLGDDPGSLEEVAAVANAMLDYVPPSAAADDADWDEHDGGEAPMSDSTVVDIKMDDGTVWSAERIADWEWRRAEAEPGPFITHYRLHDRA